MNGLTIFMASMLLSFSKPDCICANDDWSVKHFLTYTDIVLVGTMDTVAPIFIEVDTVIRGDTLQLKMRNSNPYIVMNIENYYYGSEKIKLNKDKAIIRTGGGFGDCGYRFTQGQKYIVWGAAFEDRDTAVSVHTSVCTLTGKWNMEHIKAIEKHRKRRKLKD